LSQQRRNGLAGQWIDEVRSDFGQRFQNESPLDQSRVRNTQPIFMNNLIPVEQNVDIQSAGIPTSTPDTLILALHQKARVQNLARRQAGFGFDDGVQKPWLVPDVLWFGFINGSGSNRFYALVPKARKGFP